MHNIRLESNHNNKLAAKAFPLFLPHDPVRHFLEAEVTVSLRDKMMPYTAKIVYINTMKRDAVNGAISYLDAGLPVDIFKANLLMEYRHRAVDDIYDFLVLHYTTNPTSKTGQLFKD